MRLTNNSLRTRRVVLSVSRLSIVCSRCAPLRSAARSCRRDACAPSKSVLGPARSEPTNRSGIHRVRQIRADAQNEAGHHQQEPRLIKGEQNHVVRTEENSFELTRPARADVVSMVLTPLRLLLACGSFAGETPALPARRS